MKRIGIFLLATIGFFSQACADEGMWQLTVLAQLQDKMQARGLKLTAEQIYSINNACLKDAIVRLQNKGGRMFCSGEIISDKGLFLTNHHCGYGAIQELSSPEDNILTNGFWAESLEKERPASFHIGLLKKIEDVTSSIMNGIPLSMDSEKTRMDSISARISRTKAKIEAELTENKGFLQVEIISFYDGNKYLAMIYEVFKDIRLVGTPPEAVGKFGGEADNWRWPRQTGDFSMFRIYANAQNSPANYSKDNVPYKPKHSLKINIKGLNEGDYAMTLGYPGNTTRYTYSAGIKFYADIERPKRVQLRRDIMDIYEVYMKKDPKIRLQYSDMLSGIGNYWNKFAGEARDLSKPGVYETRLNAEKKFQLWMETNKKAGTYGRVFELYEEAYKGLSQYGLYSPYFQDGIANSQPMMIALGFGSVLEMYDAAATEKDPAKKKEIQSKISEFFASQKKEIGQTYKDYYEPIETKVLEVVLRHIKEDLYNGNLSPEILKMYAKYKNNYTKMAADLYKASIFSSEAKLNKFLSKPNAKGITKDPIYIFVKAYYDMMSKTLQPKLVDINLKLAEAKRLFLAGTLEMNQGELLPADANRSMRLSYGRILSYAPQDGAMNKFYTTHKGILQKYVPGDFEFDAPAELITLLKNKDFGQYADANGDLPVCFLSDNDITGGNSGSPVINGNGELIGTAFDGNYEAIGSDFVFMPDLQRTISLDIRYTLFIIEKLGKANRIIQELNIIK